MNESNCSVLFFVFANKKMISIERELALSIWVVYKQLNSTFTNNLAKGPLDPGFHYHL